MGFSEILGAWVAAWLTLCIFSFLYKDNPFFKTAEHLFTGIALGYWLTILIFNVFIPKVYEPMTQWNFLPFLPMILGMGILTRFFPKYSWMSRISFAFIMGYTAGLTIPAAIVSRFLKQLEGTIYPLVSRSGGALDFSWAAIGHGLSVLVLVVGLLSVLIHFFFSVEHTRSMRIISRVGIYFIMIYLGAAFGTTVMGRFSLLYGRLFDLYTFRTEQYYYATPILLFLIVIFLAVYGTKYKEFPEEPPE